MVICLAHGFGSLRLEDKKNREEGGENILNNFQKFFGFDKAIFLHFQGNILEHLAHKILARFFLELSIQLFLFTELTNTFSGFEIDHIFVHQWKPSKLLILKITKILNEKFICAVWKTMGEES